ncbi:1-acyl-sn-glycerol-3-phosphate acyltransferase [Patescibacteria group bacterium]|nr:1-acyl-sn-glycerol-3-phosphate acyltransferase [Patescibacteria group bacterium]
MRIEGSENIPKSGAYIIAPNHNCWADSPIIISALYKEIIKRKLFFIAASRKYKCLGGLPIDWKNKGQVIETTLSLLEKGEIVGIFPEGGANESNSLLPGKTGLARLVLWSGCPVIPIGVIGTSGRGPITSSLKIFTPARYVTLKIGRPLHYEKINRSETTSKILHNTTEQIMEKIAELSGKNYNHGFPNT